MNSYLGKEISEEKALEILKQVSGVTYREIIGEEYDRLLLILSLLEPLYVYNNQRSITEEYRYLDKVYHVHYFGPKLKSIIEEVIEEKYQR